jgi:hypothetical protein
MGDSSPLPLGIRSDVPTDATIEIAADAVAPHIRLTIDDLDGTPVDAYGPVIDALFRQVCSVGTGPWSGPALPSLQPPVTTETTDNNRDIDSEWVITPSGAGHCYRLGSDDLPERELRIRPRGRSGAGSRWGTRCPGVVVDSTRLADEDLDRPRRTRRRSTPCTVPAALSLRPRAADGQPTRRAVSTRLIW